MPNEIAALKTAPGYVICGSVWVIGGKLLAMLLEGYVERTIFMTKSYASPGGRANMMMTHASQSVMKGKTGFVEQ